MAKLSLCVATNDSQGINLWQIMRPLLFSSEHLNRLNEHAPIQCQWRLTGKHESPREVAQLWVLLRDL